VCVEYEYTEQQGYQNKNCKGYRHVRVYYARRAAGAGLQSLKDYAMTWVLVSALHREANL